MFHVSGHLKEGESLQSCGAEDGGLWLLDVGAILLILRQHSARLSLPFLRFIMLRSFLCQARTRLLAMSRVAEQSSGRLLALRCGLVIL